MALTMTHKESDHKYESGESLLKLVSLQTLSNWAIDHISEIGHGPASDLFLHVISIDLSSVVYGVEPWSASPFSLWVSFVWSS